MAFINENISEEDKVKYKIENLSDYKYRHWSSWTIDRDRDCFLLLLVVFVLCALDCL